LEKCYEINNWIRRNVLNNNIKDEAQAECYLSWCTPTHFDY